MKSSEILLNVKPEREPAYWNNYVNINETLLIWKIYKNEKTVQHLHELLMY